MDNSFKYTDENKRVEQKIDPMDSTFGVYIEDSKGQFRQVLRVKTESKANEVVAALRMALQGE